MSVDGEARLRRILELGLQLAKQDVDKLLIFDRATCRQWLGRVALPLRVSLQELSSFYESLFLFELVYEEVLPERAQALRQVRVCLGPQLTLTLAGAREAVRLRSELWLLQWDQKLDAHKQLLALQTYYIEQVRTKLWHVLAGE
jgi:hypothetical protein